jgi:hypothetical protein
LMAGIVLPVRWKVLGWAATCAMATATLAMGVSLLL